MAQPITIEQILARTNDLPSMPAAAMAVMHEAESATATAQSIARHLRQDQALSARVLRLANSSYYGLSRQVSEVGEAVVILGTRTIRNLCLVAASYPWLTRDLVGYELGAAQLWRHSFATAVASGTIAMKSGKADKDVCFTAGLLHNIGKVALSVWLEGKTSILQVIAEKGSLSFDEVERKALGFDHAQIGEAMAERWNLPRVLTQAIRWHHEPTACEPSSPVVDAVHLGDYLATTMGFGVGADGLRYRVYDECFIRLGIEPGNLDDIIEGFLETYNREEKIFEPDFAAEAA